MKTTGSRQPFIVVGHDGWDGKRKQINGLTIFFIDPEDMTILRIPIALAPIDGKTAIELSELCMMGLERAGIEFQALYKSVNDNCKAAVKTGRL